MMTLGVQRSWFQSSVISDSPCLHGLHYFPNLPTDGFSQSLSQSLFFWTLSFLTLPTQLVHDGPSGFVLYQEFSFTIALCSAPLILHGSNLQEKTYNRFRAGWNLIFRLQLRPNYLEGKGESASCGTQDFPSSWGPRFPLGQKDEFVAEDNILKALFGSLPHHAE